jgi:hypothetical protein
VKGNFKESTNVAIVKIPPNTGSSDDLVEELALFAF